MEAPAATNGTTPKSLSVRPPPTPAASPRPLLAQTPQPPPPPAPETDDLDVAEQGLPIVYAPSDLTPVNTQPFTVRPTVPTPPPASTSSGSAGRPVRHVQQADSPWKSSLSFSQVAAKAAVSARPPPMSPASANGSSGRPPASSQQGDTSPLRRASVQATPISSPPATDTDVSSNTSASAIDGDKQPTDPFDPKLYGIPDPFPDIHGKKCAGFAFSFYFSSQSTALQRQWQRWRNASTTCKSTSTRRSSSCCSHKSRPMSGQIEANLQQYGTRRRHRRLRLHLHRANLARPRRNCLYLTRSTSTRSLSSLCTSSRAVSSTKATCAT